MPQQQQEQSKSFTRTLVKGNGVHFTSEFAVQVTRELRCAIEKAAHDNGLRVKIRVIRAQRVVVEFRPGKDGRKKWSTTVEQRAASIFDQFKSDMVNSLQTAPAQAATALA